MDLENGKISRIESANLIDILNKEFYLSRNKGEKCKEYNNIICFERGREKRGYNSTRNLLHSLQEYSSSCPEEGVILERRRLELEELKRTWQEMAPRLDLQSRIASRFGLSFGDNQAGLTEEEMKKLLEPNVDITAGKWYFFLRREGKILTLPQSMDGGFSAMIEEQARQFVQQTYTAGGNLSLDSLLSILKLDLNTPLTRQVISAAECSRIEKNFPLGKVYETVSITGLKARLSPEDTTLSLVYGLIGKRKGRVEQATKVFEKGKINLAREYITHSNTTPEHIFSNLAPYLQQLSHEDSDTDRREAAKKILSYFRDNLQTEEISDLVEGVEALFAHEERFSHLLVKMQDGRYEDMFDNSRLMACTFLPMGIYKEAALVYYNDPDIGLLHVAPRIIDQLVAPIGVAILVNAFDDRGNKWLVVDSVEGGTELERVKEKLWIPRVYQGVFGVARDTGVSAVMFNSSTFNKRPKKFLEYVEKHTQKSTVHLTKIGMRDYSHLGISQTSANEAIETWAKSTNNEVNGYVAQLN